jgi:hypothetical protein
MAIDRDHIVARGPFRELGRGHRIVLLAAASRLPVPAGIGRAQQRKPKFPLSGSNLLRRGYQRRYPAIGRIDN